MRAVLEGLAFAARSDKMTQPLPHVGGSAMRPSSLRPRPWVIPLALTLVTTRCGDVAGPGGYTVTYRASLAGIATIDSIYYGNGTGKCSASCTSDSTKVRVVPPSVTANNPRRVVVIVLIDLV